MTTRHLGTVLLTLIVLLGACTLPDSEDGQTASTLDAEIVNEQIDGRNRQLADRCGFDRPDSWTLIETFGGFDRYSLDPGNPVTSSPDRGEPGVFVQIACQTIEGLGGLGFVDLPGVSLIEDGDAPFGGGVGNRRVIHFDDPAFPPAIANLAFVIRVDGTQCGFSATGSVAALEAAAAELEAVAASLLCVGV